MSPGWIATRHIEKYIYVSTGCNERVPLRSLALAVSSAIKNCQNTEKNAICKTIELTVDVEAFQLSP